MTSDCLFCKIAAYQLPSDVVYENDHIVVFMSLENHPLIVPKRHFTDVYELDDATAAEIMKAAVKISKATKAATGCSGINLAQSNGKAAGQDVFHFHLHIKPRFENDGVVLRWDTATVANDQRRDLSRKIRSALS